MRRCEIVALPSFTFDLLDAANASAGVVLRHTGYPDQINDDIRCPNQAEGLPRLRQLLLTLKCDPRGQLDDLSVVS